MINEGQGTTGVQPTNGVIVPAPAQPVDPNTQVPATNQQPQQQEPSKPQFLSDAITTEDYKSLSLPNSTQGQTVADAINQPNTTVPNQTQVATSNNEPVAPADPAFEEAKPTELDPFAVDFDAAAPQSVIGQDTSKIAPAPASNFVPPEGSPLPADAPQWQHEAYQRVQNDESLTEEDKKTITSLPPQSWDRAKEWRNSNRKLGKLRDVENVPVEQVVEILAKESPQRVEQILQHGINRVLKDKEFSATFAANNKETYAELIQTLTLVNPEFVSSVLARQGYTVEKAQAYDAQAELEKLKSRPEWSLIEGTETGDALVKAIEERAKLQPQPVSKEQLVNELEEQDKTQAVTVLPPEVRQAGLNTYREVESNVFLSAVAQGLHAEGMRLPTDNEWKINPEACATMTNAYYLALEGGGDIPSWDEQSAKYCAQMDGYEEKVSNLQNLFASQKFEDFKSLSHTLDPYYYEFGKKRAQIGRVRASYNAAVKRLKETQVQTAPAEGVQPQSTPQPQGQAQTQTPVTLPTPQQLNQPLRPNQFVSDQAYIEAYKQRRGGS